MPEDSKQQFTDWLRQAPTPQGTLVRGIRFTDQTVFCDFDSRDFPAAALEKSWRSVGDTFQVLTAHSIRPRRLTWVYQRATLHCARRDDGTVLGVVVSRKPNETDLAGVDKILNDFLNA